MDPVLVPTKLTAFDLGFFSISVDSRWEYSRLNCGGSDRLIATVDGFDNEGEISLCSCCSICFKTSNRRTKIVWALPSFPVRAAHKFMVALWE